jgi:hypothetical protein
LEIRQCVVHLPWGPAEATRTADDATQRRRDHLAADRQLPHSAHLDRSRCIITPILDRVERADLHTCRSAATLQVAIEVVTRQQRQEEDNMQVANVSHFKVGRQQAAEIVEKVAPKFKALGVTSITLGFCYSGPDTGEITVS